MTDLPTHAHRSPAGGLPIVVSSGATIDARTGQVSYLPDPPAARCLAWAGGHFCAVEPATPGHVHRCCCKHTWETG